MRVKMNDKQDVMNKWNERQPVYYHDFMRSEAARVEQWDFKLEGWPAFREARPNSTHEAIARLDRAGKVLAVVTQNIDALLQNLGPDAVTGEVRNIESHLFSPFVRI